MPAEFQPSSIIQKALAERAQAPEAAPVEEILRPVYLPAPKVGRRDGMVETNLTRKGLFIAGRAGHGASRDSGQLVFKVLADHDKLGKIERVDNGPVLTEVEFQVLMTICTAWRQMASPGTIKVPMSLGMLCSELGWGKGGRLMVRVREALEALTQATFSGDVFDVATGKVMMVHRFGLIQEWKVGSAHKTGQMGEVGWVMLSDWLRRQLAGDHSTFYSRHLVRLLRRPVAKLLLPYLESERFERTNADGHLYKEWVVNRALFASVGITNNKDREARRTLGLAGEEIVERDEGRRWRSIDIHGDFRSGFVLRAVRAA